MSSNGFPQFSDGNVEIRFSDKDKFVLHSWQLALHSPWFKTAFSDRWNTGNSTAVDGKHHWVYELRFDKDSTIATLVRASSHASAPTDTEMLPTCSISNDEYDEEAEEDDYSDMTPPPRDKRVAFARAHQDLFRCIYHVAPLFNPEDDEDIYDVDESPIVQLCDVAQGFGCEAIVRLQIDHKLRQLEKSIELDCEANPVMILEFAARVKSDWVFKEAAIHIVGRSNRFLCQNSAALARIGGRSFDELRAVFEQRLKAVELELFRIQSQSHDGSWLGVAALNYFRQWLTEQIYSNKGSNLGPGYANLYHTLGKGLFSLKNATQKAHVRTYMNKAFRNTFTDGDMDNLEPELRKILNKAAAVVKPILKQNTRRQDASEDQHRALTFMEVGTDKLPWKKST